MLNRPELALLVAGVALLVGAAGWRSAARWRARRSVRLMLAAPDAPSRRAALDLVGDDGLSSYAAALVELVQREEDPIVLDAVADLVARTLWEPADQPRLVELRLWARGRLLAQQAPESADLAPARTPRPQPPPAPRPLRLDRDPLLRRLEQALGERVLAVRIQRPDGTVELDVFDREGASAWR
jgi:hypothetical protein